VLRATLLLLAGGEGRRMGRPKALLPVAGTTLVAWQLERLGGGFAEVLVSVKDGSEAPVGARVVIDRPGGRRGPLAGIEAGLRAAAEDAVIAVGCDLPRVDLPLLARLLLLSEGHDAAAPRLSGRAEPACGCYRRSALAVISRRLDAGLNKAADALAELDTAWLEEPDPVLFANLNTPEDYQVFLSEI
jgi:molybdopterin-guanine dinucleotide biosynthesis protein A